MNQFVESTDFGNIKTYDSSRKVVLNPDIRGGIPTISGTRVGVYEVASMAEADSMENVLDCFDTLSIHDIEMAIQYAKENPCKKRNKLNS